MPTLQISTNQKLSADAESAALAALSAQVADILGKPESYVCVLIEHKAMSFGGDATAPCVFARLVSLLVGCNLNIG